MVVGAPDVRTVAGTEVGFVAFGLVDPLPVEVPPEVDVERAQAAALVRAAGNRHRRKRLDRHPAAHGNGSPVESRPTTR